MPFTRGAWGLGCALLVGTFAACSGSRSDELGQATQADSASANLKAVIRQTNSWGSGYCANVDIINSGTATASTWVVVLELNQASIYSSWNGTFTGSGSRKTITPVGWNASVAPGTTLQAFGYCANTTGSNSAPTIISPLGDGTGGGGAGGSSGSGSGDAGKGGALAGSG